MASAASKAQKRPVLRFLGGLARMTVRLIVTVMIVTAAGLAVTQGSIELQQRAEAAPEPEGSPPTPVTAYQLNEDTGYDIQRVFVGQVEPQKTVEVSFELSGRMDEIYADEGDTVEPGALLAVQDRALLVAERDQLLSSRTATEAQLRFAHQTLKRAEELTARGHNSQSRLDEAMARVDELNARIAEIDARLDNVGIRLDKSSISAPFQSRVTERYVDGGESLAAGQTVLELVQIAEPQVRIGVPIELNEVELQTARIEIGSKTYSAALVTLRPDIDPVTRTRTALFALDADATAVFGQTARLLVDERIETPGLWVPVTSLKEGARGQWTVLAVDAEDRVRALSVQVVHANQNKVYVTGAFPDGTRLIPEGPQRLTLGQKVSVSDAS